MKTIIITFTFLLSLSVNAKINFKTFTNLDDALAASKAANKPLFVDSWATWCGWCTYMEKNIFNDEEVAEYFNANFICYKANADADNTMDFRIKYDVSGLPALIILDQDGNVLNRSDGAITETEEFIDFGKMSYYKLFPETSPWYKNEQEFKAGKRDYLFLKEYSFNLLDGDFEWDEIQEIVDLYWEKTPSKSLEDSTNFSMFYVFTDDFDDPLTLKFISDKENLVEIHGEDTYYGKGIYLIQTNIDMAVEEDNKALYQEVVEFTNKVFTDQDWVELDDLIDQLKDIWKDR